VSNSDLRKVAHYPYARPKSKHCPTESLRVLPVDSSPETAHAVMAKLSCRIDCYLVQSQCARASRHNQRKTDQDPDPKQHDGRDNTPTRAPNGALCSAGPSARRLRGELWATGCIRGPWSRGALGWAHAQPVTCRQHTALAPRYCGWRSRRSAG
jgi:hypothetical protein